jgi:hypothetical protein
LGLINHSGARPAAAESMHAAEAPHSKLFALYSMAMEQIVVVMPCLQISLAIQ